MAITFASKSKTQEVVKEKAKQVTKPVNEFAEIVEQMSALSIQMDAMKKLEKEYAALRAVLMEAIPADVTEFQDYVFEGTSHKVEFSACAKKRDIVDMEKAKEALGAELFMKIAKIGLTELDKYLSDEEKDKFIVESQTGARSCKVKELG